MPLCRYAVVLGAFVVAPVRLHAQRDLVLATTTSVRDAGLLEALLPSFERSAGRKVKVIAVGSGQAMELARRGEADILILHDPKGEQEFVAAGFGIERTPLMHNEFIIVGPREDAAKLKGRREATDAFSAIARGHARFVSRGDRSGTHVKELTLWREAGVHPAGDWYLESGQGMGATLQIANELQAYTLTDIGTFLGHRSPLELEIVLEGDTALFNPYHVLLVNPERFAWVDVEGGRALKRFLLSPETQAAIGEYRRKEFGRSLFVPSVRDGERR